MTRSKHAIVREIEQTREDLSSAAKMAAVGLLVRNPISLAARTIGGFIRRRRARSQERTVVKPRAKLYRNLSIALGTGVVAGVAYRSWRRSHA
jgi:hypothetical protein